MLRAKASSFALLSQDLLGAERALLQFYLRSLGRKGERTEWESTCWLVGYLVGDVRPKVDPNPKMMPLSQSSSESRKKNRLSAHVTREVLVS